MEKVGTVKETPEDEVELFKDDRYILLRCSNVRKDGTRMVYETKLDDKQAQALVKSIEEVRARLKQEQKEQEGDEIIRLRRLPKAFSPDHEP